MTTKQSHKYLSRLEEVTEDKFSINQYETMSVIKSTSNQKHQNKGPSTRDKPYGVSLEERDKLRPATMSTLTSTIQVDSNARYEPLIQQQEEIEAMTSKNTSKTTRAPIVQDSDISGESTAEELIKSDSNSTEYDVESGPRYSNASEDSEVEYMKTTPSKGRNELRVSQSLIMDESHIKRALGTFTASRSLT